MNLLKIIFSTFRELIVKKIILTFFIFMAFVIILGFINHGSFEGMNEMLMKSSVNDFKGTTVE